MTESISAELSPSRVEKVVDAEVAEAVDAARGRGPQRPFAILVELPHEIA